MNDTRDLDKTPSFSLTPLASIITEYALLLAGMKDGKIIPAGTGVVVGRGLLLTAAHVIDHLWATFEYCPAPGADQCKRSTFVAIAIQWAGQPSEAAIWIIDGATRCPGDIAFVKLKPGDDFAARYTWDRSLSMELDIPALGSRVAAFGYPSTEILRYANDRLDLNLRPSSTVGEVTAAYPERRDRSMLNFPCYQVNARFDGGMSGGPVLNDRGKLCGIVCSAMPTIEPPHISYVSALWPAMFANLDFELPGLTFRGSYQAWELARINALHAPDWESIYNRAYVAEDDDRIQVLRLKPERPQG